MSTDGAVSDRTIAVDQASILDDAERAALAGRLADPDISGLPDDAAKAAALSAQPIVPNPDPAPQVPRPFTVRGLVAAVAAARRANLKPYFRDLNNMVANQDRKNLREFILTLIDIGDLQAADGQAIQAALNATDPDPAWPAQVPGPSWAQRTYGDRYFNIPNPNYQVDGRASYARVRGEVTAEMVAEARSGGA